MNKDIPKGDFRWAGRSWWYNFRHLPTRFVEADARRIQVDLSSRYAKLTKVWNPTMNSEWICRLYLAAKSIMASTLLINKMYFADRNNLRAVSPYLAYYSVFTLLKGLLYMDPGTPWKGGDILKTTHSKTITEACKFIGVFDQTIAAQIKTKVLRLKACRELLSYRMPTSGDQGFDTENDLVEVCQLFAELIQFYSEILANSIAKYAEAKSFIFEDAVAQPLYEVEIEGHIFIDFMDISRLISLSRNSPKPVNVWFLMKEGWVDDFFGSWCSEDDSGFNPDLGLDVLFDIP